MAGSPRLASLPSSLAEELLRASSVELRAISSAAARRAIATALLTDTAIGRALADLEAGIFGDSEGRAQLWRLIEQLDKEAWDKQAEEDQTAPAKPEYPELFRRARAANALWAALDGSPLSAATESVYEAQAAIRILGIALLSTRAQVSLPHPRVPQRRLMPATAHSGQESGRRHD